MVEGDPHMPEIFHFQTLNKQSHLCLSLKNFFAALTSDIQQLSISLLPQSLWKTSSNSALVNSRGSGPKTFSLYFLTLLNPLPPLNLLLWFVQLLLPQSSLPALFLVCPLLPLCTSPKFFRDIIH